MTAASPAGYAHPDYARALGEFGSPVRLRKSGGYLLARHIPGSAAEDAIGCYPLFSCGDWLAVREDIGELRERFVSIALVADPFGQHDEDLLAKTFDRVIAFKSHFVVELGLDPDQHAFTRVQLEECVGIDAGLHDARRPIVVAGAGRVRLHASGRAPGAGSQSQKSKRTCCHKSTGLVGCSGFGAAKSSLLSSVASAGQCFEL